MGVDQRTYFANKKIVVSFILSLFVFFGHFRGFSAFASAGDALKNAFTIIHSLCHVAVPLFFVISGALFYRNYTLATTVEKWKKRFFSLCIPYLAWNIFWLLLGLLGYYTPLGVFTGGVKVAFSTEAVLRGIFLHAQFEPFWFLLQLIVLTALCPIVYLLLKNKWIGIISIVAFYVLYCFGFRLNTTLFGDTGMVLFYLLGAWIGIHHFELFASRRKKQAIIGFAVYISCCIVKSLMPLFPADFPRDQLYPVLRAISCAGFWIAVDFFEMDKCPRFLRESFLIYAMHSFVGAAVVKILSMFLPERQIFLVLTALLGYPSTVIIICAFGMFMERHALWLRKILVGR